MAVGLGLGNLVKVTTVAPVLVVVVLFGVASAWREIRTGNASRGPARWIGPASVVVSTLVLQSLWVWYSDSLKADVPFAREFLTSGATTRWYFGTWEQRVSREFWYEVLWRRTGSETFGNRHVWLVFLPLAAMASARARKLIALGLALSLFGMITFVNVHVAHNYYQYATCGFTVVALGLGVADLLASSRPWRPFLGLVILLAVIGTMTAGFFIHLYPWMATPSPRTTGLAHAIGRLVPPEGTAIVAGQDWSPLTAFLSQRKLVMNRENYRWTHPLMAETIELLEREGRAVRAVASCSAQTHETSKEISRELGLRNFLEVDGCGIWH